MDSQSQFFLERFHLVARGALDPFILVVEGSIPDETNKAEGHWAFRNRS
jgi:hydrogenase small subunit